MLSVLSQWLPILVAAVVVFIVSSIFHVVLKYHQSDFGPIASEDQVMDSLRGFDIPPGDYVVPYMTAENMKTEEFKAKAERGPVAFMTVLPPGMPGMGKSLTLWFLYSIVVGGFAAYVAVNALPAGAHYIVVFRVVGGTAIAGYALALAQGSIWYHKNWSATAKSVFDGVVYGLLTAGTFGWLWPQA